MKSNTQFQHLTFVKFHNNLKPLQMLHPGMHPDSTYLVGRRRRRPPKQYGRINSLSLLRRFAFFCVLSGIHFQWETLKKQQEKFLSGTLIKTTKSETRINRHLNSVNGIAHCLRTNEQTKGNHKTLKMIRINSEIACLF